MDTLNIILSLFNFALLILFLIYWLVVQNKVFNKDKDIKKVRNKVDKILEKAYEKHDEIIANAKKVSKNYKNKPMPTLKKQLPK